MNYEPEHYYGHKFTISPGIPGLYALAKCEYCGVTYRVAPDDQPACHYPHPLIGDLILPKCPETFSPWDQIPDDYRPAYAHLYDIYRGSRWFEDYLETYIMAPRIQEGSLGEPSIYFWDNWRVYLAQTYAVVAHTLPEGCGCGHTFCTPRVAVLPSGECVFIKAHGSFYEDQSQPPAALIGWENFKPLAMLMYTLPEPKRKDAKWYGRSWDYFSPTPADKPLWFFYPMAQALLADALTD